MLSVGRNRRVFSWVTQLYHRISLSYTDGHRSTALIRSRLRALEGHVAYTLQSRISLVFFCLIFTTTMIFTLHYTQLPCLKYCICYT
ncbi:hypothetical protein BYT27DRAFT_6466842 [Phlegmacium glaucopus]|nr:hypothetical protein BYT27DRAFT_6466842 [Phlegmacium glaucopus]